MADYTLRDLESWDERIREKVEEFGLDPYPQEFEICDHTEMLGYMTYSGMPSHYPHWSYGKSFEKTKTLYDHGVTGLPYEMVINSNPALGYLMRDNTLCLQILTIAHVYGHNDFFKNNFNFITSTRAETTLSMFKAHAQRVRSYVEDPSIGPAAVERILDAAHALNMNVGRNRAVKQLGEDEEKKRLWEDAQPRPDPYDRIHRKQEYEAPDLRKTPASPREDLLVFLRDYNPYLAEWEKDLLTIVHEEACYFLPQIETKIMNEGWASYWHREIMNSLELPQELHLEFLVRHNQVVRPHPGSLNPYHLGIRVWDEIQSRTVDRATQTDAPQDPSPACPHDEMFAVREVDRDISFLRRFMNEAVMRDLDLFEYEQKEDNLVVSRVSNEEQWRDVKETLLRNVGMGGTPIIRVTDADYGNKRTLYLQHEHEGRDLQLQYAEKTLLHIHELWGREAALETVLNEKRTLLFYGEDGFRQEPLA